MNPEIIYKKGFTIIGMKYEGNNQNNEIAILWKNLIGRLDEIKNRTPAKVSIGYDSWTDKINETGEFTYIAGVEVKDDRYIPEGMVSINVPSSKYAVFTIDSYIEKVGDTVKDIFDKWLPESLLELSDRYDFEYYNEQFKPNDSKSKIYFHVPVK